MVTPTAGTVVLVRFPISDLSQAKLRPTVVLADAGRFATGSLRVTSYARPAKLFTANRSLMVAEVGSLKPASLKQIIEAVVEILRASLGL